MCGTHIHKCYMLEAIKVVHSCTLLEAWLSFERELNCQVSEKPDKHTQNEGDSLSIILFFWNSLGLKLKQKNFINIIVFLFGF